MHRTARPPSRRLPSRRLPSRRLPSRRPRGDRGTVTAEAAVVLPVLLLVLAAAVAVLACVAAQLRCVDAARSGARLAARGEPPAAVVAAARAVLPAGRVQVLPDGERVRVVVRLVVRPAGGLLARLPGVPVEAAATALPEDALVGPALEEP